MKIDLKSNKWYYDFTEENFIELIKLYPYVPFFVSGDSCFVTGDTYRWNDKLNRLESFKPLSNIWEENSLGMVVDFEGDALVDFVIYESSLSDKGLTEIDCEINNKILKGGY